MRVAVIGSRTFSNYSFLQSKLSEFPITSIVSGGARGADILAARYAKEQNIPLLVFLPDYIKHGKFAPHVRNRHIILEAQEVVAFWDGHSPGTTSSLRLAMSYRVPYHIFWP